MEIFDRDWCNVFSYTVNSAALYHIKRDRAYWKDVYTVLAEFWWESVVPAKHLLQDGDNNSIDLLRYLVNSFNSPIDPCSKKINLPLERGIARVWPEALPMPCFPSTDVLLIT